MATDTICDTKSAKWRMKSMILEFLETLADRLSFESFVKTLCSDSDWSAVKRIEAAIARPITYGVVVSRSLGF